MHGCHKDRAAKELAKKEMMLVRILGGLEQAQQVKGNEQPRALVNKDARRRRSLAESNFKGDRPTCLLQDAHTPHARRSPCGRRVCLPYSASDFLHHASRSLLLRPLGGGFLVRLWLSTRSAYPPHGSRLLALAGDFEIGPLES
jgi:hypothetical protein